jgi:predicted sulfurtransferase/predicted O-methyltransferase YrrM
MPPLEWHNKLLEAKKLRQQEELRSQSDTNMTDDSDPCNTTTSNSTYTSNTVAPIIFDCRNTYETDVGIFDGAIPLQTTTFKDTWGAIEQKLANKPKDTPIYMYCTGGIRCVKVGAYVTQELGYTNVNRLAGGIIAYDRAITTNFTTTAATDNSSLPTTSTTTIDEEETIHHDNNDNHNESREETMNQPSSFAAIDKSNNNSNKTEATTSTTSLFRGINFVFDGRLGRKITDDAFGTCVTCGSKATFVSNCRNNNCHKRMVQCETCISNYFGTCSTACCNRYNMLQQQQQQKQQFTTNVHSSTVLQQSSTSTTNVHNNVADTEIEHGSTQSYTSLDSYSLGHSSPLPEVYPEMEYNTKALIPSGSHMVSGQAQGRLLKQLATMTREGRILEFGTFTGYATACLLEGSIEAGKAIGVTTVGSRASGPFVLSMERDMKAFEIAVAQLNIISEYGFHGHTAMEAMCTLRSIDSMKGSKSSTNFIDNQSSTVTTTDNIASCEIMKVSDALATIEEMAFIRSTATKQGEEDNYIAPFDLVFIDADKTRLLEYVEVCLNTDFILKKGGLIIVDNVLWKGLVLEASAGGLTSTGSSSSNKGGDDSNNNNQSDSDSDNENDEGFTIPMELRKNRRARKLANKLHRFNSAIVKDPRVEVLVLPIRDGLSIIRKK